MLPQNGEESNRRPVDVDRYSHHATRASTIVNLNKCVGPPYCQAEMYAGRVTFCPGKTR